MIRRATREDFTAVTDVALASFAAVTWQRTVDELYGPLNGHDWQARWRRRMERALREQVCLVLESSGQIIGFACGWVDSALSLAHLDLIGITPAAQGQGHGRRLLRAMEEAFRAQGAAFLTLESLIANDTANALYKAEGFLQVASHWNWFKKIDLPAR
jgi:ribosomal protein S18 acetylase RimI-like enzyme